MQSVSGITITNTTITQSTGPCKDAAKRILAAMNGDVPTPPTPEPGREPLPIAAVRASGDDGNGPANTLDGNFGTRWSANGKGQWLELDLGSVHTVNQVAIAWHLGDRRKAAFNLEVSSDNINWADFFSAASSGATTDLETFSFSPVAARFVRYVGLGNTDSDWNSLTEVRIFGHPGPEPEPEPEPDPDPEPLPVLEMAPGQTATCDRPAMVLGQIGSKYLIECGRGN